MVRTRKYTKRIYRYPKQKWSPVIKSGQVVLNQSNYAHILNLVENSSDTSTPTPVVIKTSHFKMQVDYHTGQGGSVPPYGVYAGIIYVPEGITITSRENITSLISAHPEWVIIHSLIESYDTSGNMVQKTSPLTRNLNSGDRICWYVSYDSINE